MIFFREINPLSAKLLKRIYCQSKKLQVRQRAHCLILANQGTKVENLMQIFQVSRKTIYGSSVCVMQWTGVIRDGTLI